MAWFIQVPRCTPFVTWRIGTSDASRPSHRPCQMCRVSRPCRSDTPFTRLASRMAAAVMWNITENDAVAVDRQRRWVDLAQAFAQTPQGMPQAAPRLAFATCTPQQPNQFIPRMRLAVWQREVREEQLNLLTPYVDRYPSSRLNLKFPEERDL